MLWDFVGLATLVDTLFVVELVELTFRLLGVVKIVVVPTHSIDCDNVVRLVGKLVVVTLVRLVALLFVLVLVLDFVLGLALTLELGLTLVLGLGLELGQV